MYQNTILIFIMKLIYDTKNILSESTHESKTQLKDLINLINYKITENSNLYPKLVVDGFKIQGLIINYLRYEYQ